MSLVIRCMLCMTLFAGTIHFVNGQETCEYSEVDEAVSTFFSGEIFDGAVGCSLDFTNVNPNCIDAFCLVVAGPTNDVFEWSGLLPPPDTRFSDSCEVTDGTGTTGGTVIARNRVTSPYESISCVDVPNPFGEYASTMFVTRPDGMILFLLYPLTDKDLLPLLQSLIGAEGDDTLFQESEELSSTITTFGMTNTLAEQIAQCDGIDDAEQARCLAQLAQEQDDPSYCFAAVDVYACGQILLENSETTCDSQEGAEAVECYTDLAFTFGIEAACELIPISSTAQVDCYLYAASESGDTSILDRRFSDGLERDYGAAKIAVLTYDPAWLDLIEDNEIYDLAKIMMIMPMGINGDEVYDESYCDTLHGDYGNDTENFAQYNYQEDCLTYVSWIQGYTTLSTDEEREAYLDNLAATTEFERETDE